ncbi:hypothetical protein MKX03_007249 [Papaver bracteatum]|nr:hypothetical protein MKX03_007249 [Papaver bracteatum]
MEEVKFQFHHYKDRQVVCFLLFMIHVNSAETSASIAVEPPIRSNMAALTKCLRLLNSANPFVERKLKKAGGLSRWLMTLDLGYTCLTRYFE